MKHLKPFILFILVYSLYACNGTADKSFTVNGEIKGLTKGTLYLDKLSDSIFKVVDSFSVRDNGKFTLSDALESPEIYYLRIKEKPDESILIFGEKSIVTLTSKLEKFSTSAKISGSKNHDLLTEYKKMIRKFSDSRLDLIKANIEAQQTQNQHKIDSLDQVHRSLIRRRYLYTTNFAVNHADKEVAPYLALTELFNANIKLLDTVNNSLSEKVKASKYGKQLDQFISVIKKTEQ